MENSLLQLFVTLLCLMCRASAIGQTPKHYIVYMGCSINNAKETIETVEAAHLNFLSSTLQSKKRERSSLIHVYSHAFKGFSTMLTEEEASVLSGQDEVISVFPDPTLHLHTTRSWDFLKATSGVSSPSTPSSVSDVIIGVIDSGIWPESPSFNDHGITKIPARWKGVCMEGSDFKKFHCNRKLIGARYYNTSDDWVGLNVKHNKISKPKSIHGSPRDERGHGTHTASTAGGAMVANASYFGLGEGMARGGLPTSRIAMYKACPDVVCSGATILKAMDDAIKDGVNIISVSLGLDAGFEFLNDPVAIAAFHANQKGILVVCSGGNDGPAPYTITNSAPWILTVAASSIDRDFHSPVILGNGHVFMGTAINLSNLTKSSMYPLVFGGYIESPSTEWSEGASNCLPGFLQPKHVAGKVIVCVDTNKKVTRQIKRLVAESTGAKGMVFIEEEDKGVPMDSGVFPFSQVGNADGHQILKYINSTKNPKATILATVDVERTKPAPVIADFSSRGPNYLTETIIKPDITAPGIAILAATIPTELGNVPSGKQTSMFRIESGTSMSCPHVAGAAAVVKSVHPSWSSSMIKSAIMTTATTTNNMGKPITNSVNGLATPHDAGTGEISPLRALHPGLVYETNVPDYLHFLCYIGYKDSILQSLSGNHKFFCPGDSREELISDLNYPSISIANLGHSVRMVTRTVTNVGEPNTQYRAKVESPGGLVVDVSPERLIFTKDSKRASFNVSFYRKGAMKGYQFGSVTWSDGVHFVRTMFAVNVTGK